jgi:AcrR family transcriptional regulator
VHPKHPDISARLLDIALDLFSRRGYEGTGVQEIVAAAGVTKPTLYHYFGSKIGVLKALLDRHGKQLLIQLQKAAAYKGDLAASLDAVVAAYFGFAKENPSFYRFTPGLVFLPPEHEAAEAAFTYMQSQIDILEALFTAAARDHGNMRGRQLRYAMSLQGTINAYVARAINHRGIVGEESRRNLVHQFSHGIYS